MKLRIGTAGRPCSGQSVSGDAWSIRWIDGRCRIALVDGAGHGPAAADAAAVALDVLDQDPSVDPAYLLKRCHEVLGRSRGAVMSIAVVQAEGTLHLAGVGNIESHLLANGHEQHLVTQRGMLGANLPRLRPLEIALDGDWLLILHSDGVSARFRLADPALAEQAQQGPDALAATILEHYARPHDDAAVVAVIGREKTSDPS